jgi:polyisoprenoid-binding protein YceI
MMFKILFHFILLLSLPFALQGAQEKWTFDPEHSYVLWKINHLGFSTQSGKFYANGELIIDEQDPQNSKVNATIKINDLVTGIPELDKHLKSTQFFDSDKYPVATFVSNKVDVLSKTTAKVEGILTLHGVSKPLTLHVTLNKVGKNPINDKMTMGFTATTDMKRSSYDMKTFLPHLGDEVTIEIDVEANKK